MKLTFKRIILLLPVLCGMHTAEAALSGTYTINPAASASSTNYQSLTAAITDLGVSGGVSGPVIFELDAAYTSSGETFPLTLGAVTGANGTNTITIRPAAATSSARSLTAGSATIAINIDGGDYFIIDGRPGGTGSNKYLTIENSGTTVATVSMLNDATNNIIRYCTINGANATATSGVLTILGTTTSDGNDNNTIDNCVLTDNGSGTPANLIYAAGTSTKENGNCTISNCNLSNFFASAATSAGVYVGDYNTAWTLSGNSIYQTSSRTATGTNTTYGIAVIGTAMNNFTISGNYIGGGAAQCGGTAWTQTGGFIGVFTGIHIAAGATATGNSLQGNTIANIAWSTISTANTPPLAWNGMYIASGSVTNIGTVTGNTIGAATGTGSVTVTNTAASGNVSTAGISAVAASGQLNIYNNRIGSVTSVCSTAAGGSIYGMFLATTGILDINNNTIGSTATANSINASTASTLAAQVIYGIQFTGSGTAARAVTNNTIANINNNGTGASTSAMIKTTAGACNFTGNTIRDISTASSSTNTGVSISLYGIFAQAQGAVNQTYSNNTIYNLRNTNTTANVYIDGMILYGGTLTNVANGNILHSFSTATSGTPGLIGMEFIINTFTASNNTIRFGIDGTGTSITASHIIYGMREPSSGVANLYHNTIYVGGTGANGSSATYTFYTNNNTARSIINNILVNNRSNSGTGTGVHAGIRLPASITNITLNNNLYQFSGTGGVLGLLNTTSQNTLSGWQTATGKEAASIVGDPLFLNATGSSSTVNLHLDNLSPAESAGATGTGITTDVDGDIRANYSPVDIGADAGDFNAIRWSGNTDNDWSTGTNWVGNAAPLSTESAIIPGAITNYPIITTGTISAKTIIINTGATVTVSGGTLQLTGNITNSGTLNATGGTIALNGSTAQSIKAGTLNATSLTLNNSTGATIVSGMVNVLSTYTPTAGILTTSGYLTLKSSSLANTARVAAGGTGGGYISGNVTVERFIPGRRAYRFMAHPFTSAIALSQLTDDIDITGKAGAAGGFTETQNNNPSAFSFNVNTADNSNTGNNPGWAAYTSTSSATWGQYEAARIMVRGAKGEGLTGATYTESDVVVDMTGALNQGNVTIPLTQGSSSDFILIGNPFASQVNMDAVSGSNLATGFYIWDAHQGTRGGYTSYTFGSSSFNLPSCASFVTKFAAAGAGSITFEEGDKTNGAGGPAFKGTANNYKLQLRMEDSSTFWDRLIVRFDDNAMATVDRPDAVKLYNPDISFYTLSADDSMLSIDARPYADSSIIPLGLYSTLQKSFTIKASEVELPVGTHVYLHDKFLNKIEEIKTAGYAYSFTVTADTASWGNHRFELNTQGKPVTTGITTTQGNKLKVKLVPNPSAGDVSLYYEGFDRNTISITVTDMVGAKHYTAQQQSNGTGNVQLPTSMLAPGVYNITVNNNGVSSTQKFIKQ